MIGAAFVAAFVGGSLALFAPCSALLLPALGKARAQAHGAKCLGQLQQWGLALHLYADDYEDVIPRRAFHSWSAPRFT